MLWICSFALWMAAAISVTNEQRCNSYQYPCADGKQCVSDYFFCDGFDHCRDGSDEPLRNISIKYDANQTFCKGSNGHICAVGAHLATNSNRYCSESGIDVQCKRGEFSCADGSGCFESSFFCDGDRDCGDGSDEDIRNFTTKYDANQTFCRGRSGHICVLRDDLITSYRGHCLEPGVEFQCESGEFSCADGSQCIQGHRFCDGTNDAYDNCRDGSDEIRGDGTHFQYDSVGNSCLSIHTSNICTTPTGVAPKKLELCQTNYLGKYRFGCLSKPTIVIPKSTLCNGKFDCPDRSDECLCSTSRHELCERTTSEDKKTTLSGQDVNYHYKCQNEEKAAIKCDGIAECYYFWEEECNCTENPNFCANLTNDDFGNRIYSRCLDGFAPRLTSLYGVSICDGVAHCANHTDERGCKASRFYCTNDPLPNIPLTQICDGDINCENEADELSNGSHFCCGDSGNLNYISKPMVCDGIQDCKTGSDECQSCIVSAFSDDSSLISIKPLLGVVWIISTTALVGCLLVLASTTHDLVALRNTSGNTKPTDRMKIIKMLILSLSISDLLVALYTLIICIKAVELNDEYCLVDREWRSSSTCSALGAILMIGSEQSVFTMVLIASDRLHAVARPFARPNIVCATVALISSWLISIILGVVPLISRLEDYFVSNIMFNENEIFRVMYHNDTDYMIGWLSLMHENTTIGDDFGVTNWSKIRNLTAAINPNITVKYEFGYYSSHTVCLPTFFPDPEKERAGGYTLFILLINFFAFLYMAACYIIFYRLASTSSSQSRSDESQQNKDEQNAKIQRKLTRILVTDFLCWMPICIMGFLQLSGVKISKDAYLPAGLIIVPINSALNPFLYSDLPEILMEKLELAWQRLKRPAENHPEVIEMM